MKMRYMIYIKNLNQDTIATIKSNEGETKAIETVKENIDKFTTKTIKLIKDSDGNIYVKQVEQGDRHKMSHKFVEICRIN